jgi:hypothetical protein
MIYDNLMIVSGNNLIKIKEYQMDQMVGKERIIQKELSYVELVDLIRNLPSITRLYIGNRNHSITTKIIFGRYTLYDWYDNKFSGL